MPGPATLRYGLLWFGSALAATAGLALTVPPLGWLWSWLLAITAVTFAAYGFDKGAARAGWLRVPERLLLGLVLCGGTLGALAAMPAFRHKTVKGSFRLKLWLVVAAQVALGAAYGVWWQGR